MENLNRFFLNCNVAFGIRSSCEIINIFNAKNINKPLFLIDENVYNTSYAKKFLGNIEEHLPKYTELLLRGNSEPDYDYLDCIVDQIRQQEIPDIIVGIGGGSCLDITKAAAALLNNEGRAIQYRGFDKLMNRGIPTVCVPTTAGTGSEATINAVFIDKNENRKLGINGRYMNASYAILDACWMEECPFDVARSAGLDALTHALESFTCNKSNAITKIYSKAAVEIIFKNIFSLAKLPYSLDMLQGIMIGAHLAAIGLYNSGSGIAGALSYPIGVYNKVPHGIAGAIFLPTVTEFNIDNGYEEYALLYDLIDIEYKDSNRTVRAKKFHERLCDLYAALQVPSAFSEWGISQKDIPFYLDKMKSLQGAFDQNPVPFSVEIDLPVVLGKHFL